MFSISGKLIDITDGLYRRFWLYFADFVEIHKNQSPQKVCEKLFTNANPQEMCQYS